MSGVQFADFGKAIELGNSVQLARLQTERANALRLREQEDLDAQQYIPAALQGDAAAIAKLPGRMQLQLYGVKQSADRADREWAMRLDKEQRDRIIQANDWQSTAAQSILSAPPEERQKALDAAIADGEARGYGQYLKNIPRQYGPAMDGWLKYHAAKSADYRKTLADMPTPMGPAPGGAPAPGAPGMPAAPGAVDIGRAGNAISGIESGNRYDALGPVTNGDRAYGKYQVMGANIPQWTQVYYGKTLTPEQFLANPDAQEAVFRGKFGEYAKKYGPEGAARAWFAGEGGMNNPNAKDVLGTSVAGYAGKFSAAYGVGSAAGTAPPAFAANAIAPAPMEGMPQYAPAPGNVPLADRPPVPGQDAVLQMLAARQQAAQANANAPMLAGGQGAPAPAPGLYPVSGGDQVSVDLLNRIQLPPGAAFTRRGPRKELTVKDGHIEIMYPDGRLGLVTMPKDGPQGPFAGTGAEVQAFNYLVSTGRMTAEQAANVLGGRTVTNPADGSIVFVPASTLAGVAPGAPAGTQPPAGGPAPGNAAPPGTVPITPPKPQVMNNEQARDAGFADRMLNSAQILDKVAERGSDWRGRGLELLPGSLGNSMQSDDYQSFKQARDDFINAQLRRESGAAISKDEYAKADQQYFPIPGDSDATIKQKAKNRQLAVDAMVRGAGPAYKVGPNVPQPNAPPPTTGADGPRLSPEQAAKLPPGTPFIGLDGQPRVRN